MDQLYRRAAVGDNGGALLTLSSRLTSKYLNQQSAMALGVRHLGTSQLLLPTANAIQGTTMKKTYAIVGRIVLILTTYVAAQQDMNKRPSPPAHTQCKFADGKTIEVDYSSLRMNDPTTGQARKIF